MNFMCSLSQHEWIGSSGLMRVPFGQVNSQQPTAEPAKQVSPAIRAQSLPHCLTASLPLSLYPTVSKRTVV
ncbi:hypothetical protein ACLKA6_011584 [Drosophila palustris]